MGNHDEAVFRDAVDFNPHARGAVEYTRRKMKPHWYDSSEKKARWNWLKNLPLRMQEGRFLFVHGSPRDPVAEYLLPTEITHLERDAAATKYEEVFAAFARVAYVGHTHMPGLILEDYTAPSAADLDHRATLSPDVKAVVNLALARGMFGRPKCGIMPIRGHSGVQGGGECGVRKNSNAATTSPSIVTGTIKAAARPSRRRPSARGKLAGS